MKEHFFTGETFAIHKKIESKNRGWTDVKCETTQGKREQFQKDSQGTAWWTEMSQGAHQRRGVRHGHCLDHLLSLL